MKTDSQCELVLCHCIHNVMIGFCLLSIGSLVLFHRVSESNILHVSAGDVIL
jgi:hypothetical protein